MTRIEPDYYNVNPHYMPDGWCPVCHYVRSEDDLAWSDWYQDVVCSVCADSVKEEDE